MKRRVAKTIKVTVNVDYDFVDFRTLVASGRARKLDWKVDDDGVERGYDHETETYCVALGRFPGS